MHRGPWPSAADGPRATSPSMAPNHRSAWAPRRHGASTATGRSGSGDRGHGRALAAAASAACTYTTRPRCSRSASAWSGRAVVSGERRADSSSVTAPRPRPAGRASAADAAAPSRASVRDGPQDRSKRDRASTLQPCDRPRHGRERRRRVVRFSRRPAAGRARPRASRPTPPLSVRGSSSVPPPSPTSIAIGSIAGAEHCRPYPRRWDVSNASFGSLPSATPGTSTVSGVAAGDASLVVVEPDLAPDLTRREVRGVHVGVGGVRADAADELGELAGADPLRDWTDDAGGVERTGDRRRLRRAGLGGRGGVGTAEEDDHAAGGVPLAEMDVGLHRLAGHALVVQDEVDRGVVVVDGELHASAAWRGDRGRLVKSLEHGLEVAPVAAVVRVRERADEHDHGERADDAEQHGASASVHGSLPGFTREKPRSPANARETSTPPTWISSKAPSPARRARDRPSGRPTAPRRRPRGR